MDGQQQEIHAAPGLWEVDGIISDERSFWCALWASHDQNSRKPKA